MIATRLPDGVYRIQLGPWLAPLSDAQRDVMDRVIASAKKKGAEIHRAFTSSPRTVRVVVLYTPSRGH